MDHKFSPADGGTEVNVEAPRKLASKILLLALTSVLAFFFLSMKDAFLFVTSYAAAAGILAFFVRERAYGAIVVPAVASLVCFPHFAVFVPALLFMVLLAFLCSSYLKDRPGQFAFFTMCAVLYSIAAFAAGVYVAVQYFGSVEACLDALTRYAVSVAELLFSSIPERLTANVAAEELSSVREAYLSVAEQVIYLIPSVLVIFSMYAAFLTKRVFTQTLGGKRVLHKLFSPPCYPPVLLAVCYMILSFAGILFALSSEQTYYTYANVMSVLGVIFAYVGIVEYFGVLKSPVHPRQRVVYVVVGIVVTVFLTASAFTVLAYYGAYRTVFSRVRVIRITKK